MEDNACHDCGEIVYDDHAEYLLLGDGALALICIECVMKRRMAAQARMNEAAK